MSPPGNPSDESPDSTGPPDRQTLRLLETYLSNDALVSETRFEPNTHEPRLLRAQLKTHSYPRSVERVRLDIRWFTSGDFSVHYVETSQEDIWECRWDRHPNDHNARLHFHRPPDGTEIEDLSLSSTHPLDIYSIGLSAVERRIETHWQQ